MSNVFVIIKMCYVHNQWYDISYVILCIVFAVMKQRPEELAGVYLRCFAVQKLLAKSDRRPRRIIPLDNECAYSPPHSLRKYKTVEDVFVKYFEVNLKR